MTDKRFELADGTIFESNEKGNYFYKSTGRTDKKGNPVMMRVSRAVYEQGFDQYIAESRDAADKDAENNAKEAEDTVNGKKKTPAKKTRRSKDVAFEYCPNGTDTITLTAKQVEFMAEMTKTSFWESGLESTLWCDTLADEIGGQFAGKPMTVGAMISTLREKGLVNVGRDLDRKGHPKFMELTEVGKEVAKDLGLH